jgi:uncharacterized protein (TIGR00255 family)
VRGKVEVYLKFKEIEEDLTVSVDPGVVRGYVKALKELASFADAPEDIRLSHLLRIEGILKSEKNRDVEEYWAAAEPLLREVLAGYEESRKKEGEATANDISRLLGTIEESLKEIEKLSPALESYFTDTIRTRMEELLRDQADEPRILSEVALLLVKYSVNEEIVRLKAHLASFTETMHAGGGIGKKLDFICQELGREINTIGSKSVLADVTRRVVEVKDALENIREQVRNVE